MKKETYAIRGYFFGKNYSDLMSTIRDSFANTWAGVVDTVKAFSDIWDDNNPFLAIGLYLFYTIMTVVRFVFGFLFTILISILHIIIVTIVMVFIYLGYIILAFIDKIYRQLKKISNNCPNIGCNRKFDVPVYHCPKCGAPHKYLYPNSYGILHHRCTCGEKLPTLLINGRHKLEQTCPHCHGPVIKGIYSSTLFPVFGGKSSGKTCFINAAITEIENQVENKYEFKYFYDRLGDERSRFESMMKSGILPTSTHDMNMLYYNFHISPKKAVVKNFISIADIAGETFTSSDAITRQAGYKYADAVIFVLDPLAIDMFRDRLVDEGYDVTDYSASDQQVSDILATVLHSLDELYHTTQWNLSLAVAVTKADIPSLDEAYGENAIQTYMTANPNLNYMQARDALVEKFLIENGEGNAVNLMKSKFKEIHYFPTSAIGKDHVEGEPFNSYGNAAPLLYVINRAYKNLNFDKAIGR